MISGDDPEANYAYYCLHEFHWVPSRFVNMAENEKAFVIAAIDIRLEKEKADRKRMEAEMRRR